MTTQLAVGFIGLGMMGHGMARNLLRKGHGLRFIVHRNRAQLHDLVDAGTREVHTCTELVTGVDAVILLRESLPTTSYLAEAAHQSFVQASNLGFGDRFIASLLEAQEQLNGVKIVPR